MKKMFVFALAALCVFSVCSAFAVPQHQTVSTKTVLVDRNVDGKIDGVDIYDADGKVITRGDDTNGDNVVDTWNPTDVETGLPIVTQSDEAFELN